MDPETSGAAGSGLAPTTADIGPRVLARLLDALIVGLGASLALAILQLPPPTLGLGGIETWTHSAVTAGLWWAYYVAFESLSGATLGKRIVKLRVVAAGGGRATLAAAALRNAWILFGLVPWIGGVVQIAAVIAIVVTVARHERNRGWHDRLAGTVVTGPGIA